ncbi:single-stranded DNA-binding protein [Nocardia sp. MW-W600-9]
MAGETMLPLIGNLCSDIELKFTPAGTAVANCTVASTPRVFDRTTNQWRDGQPLFMRCNLWREVAEHAAESLSKGARVLVVGKLRQRSFQTNEGEKRTVVELDVDEIGPSLRYATAKVTRTNGNGNGNQATNGFGRSGTRPASSVGSRDAAVADAWSTDNSAAGDRAGDGPWATPVFASAVAGVSADEPPF